MAKSIRVTSSFIVLFYTYLTHFCDKIRTAKLGHCSCIEYASLYTLTEAFSLSYEAGALKDKEGEEKMQSRAKEWPIEGDF